MNDDPSGPSSGPTASTEDDQTRESPAGPEHARRAAIRKAFNRSRSAYLSDLIRQLDILIYAELSVIYYMDASFFFLLVRTAQHFLLLTPVPAHLPDPPFKPSQLFIFLSITGLCLLCVVSRIFFDAPSASEITRFYLHGGLAIDFIGQKGPTSRIHLVVLDLIVWGLQTLMLDVIGVHKKARDAGGLVAGQRNAAFGSTAGLGFSGAPTIADLHAAIQVAESAAGPEPVTATPDENRRDTEQTLEFEERGELASDFRPEDVELRTLNRRGASRRRSELPSQHGSIGSLDADYPNSRPRNADLANGFDDNFKRRADAQLFDAFSSGEAVVADISVTRLLARQWTELLRIYNNPETAAEREERLSQAIAQRREYLRQLERAANGTV